MMPMCAERQVVTNRKAELHLLNDSKRFSAEPRA